MFIHFRAGLVFAEHKSPKANLCPLPSRTPLVRRKPANESPDGLQKRHRGPTLGRMLRRGGTRGDERPTDIRRFAILLRVFGVPGA